MEKLAEGIYVFSNIVANQYLLVDQDGLTLIDTGLTSNYRTLVLGMQSIGHDMSHLRQIFITHADGDHFGALARLKKAAPAIACTSKLEAEAIEAGNSSREIKPHGVIQTAIIRTVEPIFHSPAAKIDRIISPGDQLPVLGGMLVIDSSGHTPGHLSFYLPHSNILFSGDSIFPKKGKLIPSYGINCWDESRAIKSLEKQLELSPRLICGGHSVIHMDSLAGDR